MVGDYRICSELRKIKEQDHKSPEFVYQASSHNFLSVIFGIFGSFGIEIGDPKNIWSKMFRRKKIRTLFVENFLGPKFFDFWPMFFRWKSQWKYKFSRFWKFFETFSKFQNFEFSLTFQRTIFRPTNRKIMVKKSFISMHLLIFYFG